MAEEKGAPANYEGWRISKIKEQFDAEGVIKFLLQSFLVHGDALAQMYLQWLKKQPQPRPRHAICCVLGNDDRIKAKTAPWIVVPDDGKCPFPVDWKLLEDPDTQLLVFVQIPFGKGSVKGHSIHAIGESLFTGMGSDGNK